MDDTDNSSHFLKCWFSGVDGFLKDSSEASKIEFLDHCAKACSTSYSLNLYQEAFLIQNSLSDSFDFLKNKFEDFDYELKENSIRIIYRHCGCDLVRSGLIKSPMICLCSKKSLEYNLNSVMKDRIIEVKKITTILEGSSNCIFEVQLLDKKD